MAVAVLGAGLAGLHVPWPPGTWQGAAGALAYALAKFLLDCRDEFPTGQGWLYLAQVVARVILGAIVGAATLSFHDSAAFLTGLAGPAALVGLGARFGRPESRRGKDRRESRRDRKEAATNADDRPDAAPDP
jgi:hypothetical protein